jgi:phosphosulfolactate synthase (CoM biosynthesis protein A)
MIYGFLKDYKYLSTEFIEISNNFSSKSIEGYCKSIKNLCLKMKSLGATRPYYVCEKILELYDQYLNVNKAEAINIDID